MVLDAKTMEVVDHVASVDLRSGLVERYLFHENGAPVLSDNHSEIVAEVSSREVYVVWPERQFWVRAPARGPWLVELIAGTAWHHSQDDSTRDEHGGLAIPPFQEAYIPLPLLHGEVFDVTTLNGGRSEIQGLAEYGQPAFIREPPDQEIEIAIRSDPESVAPRPVPSHITEYDISGDTMYGTWNGDRWRFIWHPHSNCWVSVSRIR